jgi:peptide deformylase
MTHEPTEIEPIEPEGPDDEHVPELDAETQERRRLALAQVRRFGDPVLRSPASPVADFGTELSREAERMVGLMRDALGVGLAATQLGVMRRLLVFQAGPDATPTAVANPEIEWRSEVSEVAEEGCLSLPGIVVDVERPLHVRVSGRDVSGQPLRIEASGLEARVLQHEVDHLDGVLMIDRAGRDQRRGALRALREGTSYSPEPDVPEEPGVSPGELPGGNGARDPAPGRDAEHAEARR